MERKQTPLKTVKSPRKPKTRAVTERPSSLDLKRKCKVKLAIVNKGSKKVRKLKYTSTNSDNCTMEGIIQSFFASGGNYPDTDDQDSRPNSEYNPAPPDTSSQGAPSEPDSYQRYAEMSYKYGIDGETLAWGVRGGRSSPVAAADGRNSPGPAQGQQVWAQAQVEAQSQVQTPGEQYAPLDDLDYLPALPRHQVIEAPDHSVGYATGESAPREPAAAQVNNAPQASASDSEGILPQVMQQPVAPQYPQHQPPPPSPARSYYPNSVHANAAASNSRDEPYPRLQTGYAPNNALEDVSTPDSS
ncbi:hypothetical protein BXZ70DRAFT_949368 [Cristinia sonorae]|uniref:Uncharacterized protein n=1 Tax=Cristinia sonorae TaxID=1940300 RepID=A0A8K0UIE4_9AGAR|nr:hypothetical protein BXZ70DRAFT_949368 [Cristinia sonorae]